MSVYDKVVTIISEKLSVDKGKITPQSSFSTDLEADSLDIVEIVMAIEEEFSTDSEQFEIPEKDMENIQTVKEFVDYLDTRGISE